jgi:hypothetical protein
MSKFIWGLVVAFMAVVGLTACGSVSDDNYRDEPELSSLDGILTEQLNTDGEPGTHFLELENGDKVSLNSLEINLSDVAYLDNRLKATGVMNSEEEIFTVTGISVFEILSDVKAVVVEFIEYENPDLGFVMQYYNDWKVGTSLNTVVFTAPNPDVEGDLSKDSSVVISQSMFGYEPTIDPETQEQDTPLDAYKALHFAWVDDFGDHMVKMGPDQLDAIKVEEKAGAIMYYLYRFGLIYEIKFEPGDVASNVDKDLVSFNEMVSQFSFMPFEEHGVGIGSEDSPPEDKEVDTDEGVSIPEVDMKMTSFESLLFKFSGKLPANWYYAGTSQPGTLHHYGFSEEVVEDGNEIIGLDVLAESDHTGPGVSTETQGDDFFAYILVGGQHFRVTGPSEYSDLITLMAASIEPLDTEE